MAIAVVQTGSGQSAGSSSPSLTPGAAPTAGNCQIISLGVYSATASPISSITQTNCTWQRAAQSNTSCAGGDVTMDVWYCMNAGEGGSPGTSITINLSSALTVGYNYLEYSGVATVSALDKTATSQDSQDGGGG